MKQKKMLTLTLSQLKQLYQQELPELCQLAGQSINDKDFRNSLERFLSLHPQAESNPGKQIRLLINYDGTNIHELSTGQDCTDSLSTPPISHRATGKYRSGNRLIHRLILSLQKTGCPRNAPPLSTTDKKPYRTLGHRTG